MSGKREKFNKLWNINDDVLKNSFQRLFYNRQNAYNINEVEMAGYLIYSSY